MKKIKKKNGGKSKKKSTIEIKASKGKNDANNNILDAKKTNKNSEDIYYEIEEILGHRKKSKNTGKYKHVMKVRWKGYKEAGWIDEDVLREDIEDEVIKYFDGLKKTTKPKKKQTKKDVIPVVKKCKLSHKNSFHFRKTENSWEVSKVKCRGTCQTNFANNMVCNTKNPVWVCEGNKNECYCDVLYCNKCYIEKFLNNEKGNIRSSRRK